MDDEELENMRTYFGISEHQPRVLPYVTVTLKQVAEYVASRDQQIALAAQEKELSLWMQIVSIYPNTSNVLEPLHTKMSRRLDALKKAQENQDV